MASRENPVNWLLGNREILAVLFVAVAWLAQKLGVVKDKKAAPGGAPKAEAVGDGEAERTRRVQEEIRRKISERRAGAPPVPASARSGGEPPPPLLSPRPVAPEPGGLWGDIFQAQSEESPAAEPSPREAELEAVLARQRGLGEKMRQLESASSAASAGAGGVATVYSAASMPQPGAVRMPVPSASPNAWLAQLQERQTARRAIVLREVLGPPVGMRR